VIRIKFYGAAGTVTGSMHLVQLPDMKFLVDAGYFQGTYEDRNGQSLEELKDVPYLFLTHAHLDHVGRLPILVRDGFRGTIITHRATWALARYILEDAYNVMEEDEKLYTMKDLRNTFRLPVKLVQYDHEYSIGDLKFRVRDAGHILGSAFFEFEYRGRRFTFSGDLGNEGKPIVRDPTMPSKTDVLIVESTYGNREHRPFEESAEELREAIFSTLDKGKVLIPSFALERAQEILYVFKEWEEQNKWKKGWRVILDSPLAARILTEYLNFPECYDRETFEKFIRSNPMQPRSLTITMSRGASRRLNSIEKGISIIAGSGMLTGGRSIHHLRHMIENPDNAIIFVGYQAKGTLGRKLVDGEQKVWINDRFYDVNLKIYTINGFSSHAGRDTLLRWIDHADPDSVIIVHGEDEEREALEEGILDRKKRNTARPLLEEELEL